MTPVEKMIQLDRMKRLRVFCIGDSMSDIFCHGRMESCQDDCPKFVEENRVICRGGASNAANSILKHKR